MELSDVKIEFIDYLIESGKIPDGKDLIDSDISLFSYLSEFKEFLYEENYADSDVFTKSLSDIEEMEFVDGKLTDKDEISENGLFDEEYVEEYAGDVDEAEEDNTSEISLVPDFEFNLTPSGETDAGGIDMSAQVQDVGDIDAIPDETLIINDEENSEEMPEEKEYTTVEEILEDMYADEYVIQYLDLDGDGILSDEEKEMFEKYVQGEDEELSLDKLKEIYNQIKDDLFDVEAYEKFRIELTTPEEETETQKPSSTGGGGGGNYTPAPSSKKEEKKTLDKMNKTELEAEKTTAQSTLNEKQTQLTKVLNGTDDSISQLQGDVDTAYEAFQKALTEVAPELAKELDDVVGRIKEQESAIDAKEMEVAQQESKVSIAETDLSNAKSTRDAAKASLDALNDVPITDLDSEQISTLSSKKAAAQAAVNAAETAVQTAEENLKNQKDQLDKLNNELDNLKGEQGLGALQKEKEAVDEKISTQKPELADLQKAYNDAKSTYDQWKPQFVAAAKEEFLDAQKYINEINAALNNVENKQMQRELKFSKNGEFFVEGLETTSEYVKHDGVMPYLVVGPEDPDPNVEYPVLVFLHGAGEFGVSKSALEGSSLPYVLMNGELRNGQDVDLTNFNGYIIFPHASNGSWTGERRLDDVHDVLDDFSKTHNIDKEHISLSGHSAGGIGALYFARYFNEHQSDYHFNKVAVISGYASSAYKASDIDIPMRGYNGTNDSNYMTGEFKNAVGAENLFIVNTGHGSAPEYSYMLDEDGNGISDMLEWLFSDDDE